MGVITIVLAIRGPGMAANGWQVEVTAWLGHTAAVIQRFLAFAPGWVYTLVVFGLLAYLLWKALNRHDRDTKVLGDSVNEESCPSCVSEIERNELNK